MRRVGAAFNVKKDKQQNLLVVARSLVTVDLAAEV